jgi:ABC-type amino acid transport substrate-binding protein
MSRTAGRASSLVLAFWLVAAASLAAAGLAAPSADEVSPQPLRICLEADQPPFSSATGPDRGIDHEISAHVAAALARPLRVEWFEASSEDETPMAQRAVRLLTEAGCDLIAGHPLTRDGLRASSGIAASPARAREPADPASTTRLLASRPYLSLPLVVVCAAEGLKVDTLDDLIGLRVAVERGSLASVIASVHAGAALQKRLLRASPEADAIFDSVETGAADAALIERHRFELYRARAPATRLRETGYRHPLGVNTGFVGRAPELISRVDAVIRDLVASGVAARIVEARRLGYSPPLRPAILPPLTPRLLAQPRVHP